MSFQITKVFNLPNQCEIDMLDDLFLLKIFFFHEK